MCFPISNRSINNFTNNVTKVVNKTATDIVNNLSKTVIDPKEIKDVTPRPSYDMKNGEVNFGLGLPKSAGTGAGTR